EADVRFISSSEHNYLDPQKISWLHDSRIAEHLFEPLVVYDFDAMEHRPGVAESWEVSDDGRVWTFHLRREVKWSNGDPVTAQDFLYAWRRALLPDSAADYTRMLFTIEGAQAFFHWRQEQLAQFQQVRQAADGQSSDAAQDAAEAVWQLTQEEFARSVGVTTPDDHTLVVRLERPVPYFLDLAAFITFTPVHRASVEQATHVDPNTGMVRTDPTYWSDPNRLVCNGPYRLADRRFKEYVLLKANEHYWNRQTVRNGSILERIISDPQNALLTYQSGGADLWLDVPTASSLAADLLAQNRADVHTQAVAGTYFYNFNCLPTLPDGRANPLADVRIRRALSLAIDREALVKHVTGLNQPIAETFIPPGVIAQYDPPAQESVGFDPQQARELLAEAGYANGRDLTGLSILYNTGQGHERVAQAIQAMWEEHLGVSVPLEGLEVNAFKDRLKSHNFTISRASWFGDYPDPTTWLDKMATGDGNNDCGWSNAQYDALLAQARQEMDQDRRMALLRQAEAILLREQPMALLYQYVNVYLWDADRVQGLRMNPWARWRLEGVVVQGASNK
ncbi:MAG TPA: peptide ABC transporter substrate-binding protein, partial [Phycisphaeraceae bacterium]